MKPASQRPTLATPQLPTLYRCVRDSGVIASAPHADPSDSVRLKNRCFTLLIEDCARKASPEVSRDYLFSACSRERSHGRRLMLQATQIARAASLLTTPKAKN